MKGKIVFEDDLTGKELKKKKGHEGFSYEDDTLYHYIEKDIKTNGVPDSSAVRIRTDSENEAHEKNIRILELRELISDKKLLDEPCTTEQAELRQLLGL